MNPNLTISILCGGIGKRMNSSLPKVLHEVHGVPMLVKIIEQCIKLHPQPTKILVVVGQHKPIIESTLSKWNMLDQITFAIQDQPLGTGNAVLCTLNHLDNDGYNIILNGDCPLLTSNTISDIIQMFVTSNVDIQITSICTPNPTGSGRIIKNESKQFIKIVEEKDCNQQQKQINEINIGIYIVKNHVLKKYIPMIQNHNAQHEYYLTDIVELYVANETKHVGLIELPSTKLHEIANVNTIEELHRINQNTLPSVFPFV
jgi:bifunctional UDP-N-acetylglucosamine pyrophosphorylase/glucosamine-1-phosphate N-acetyltransferase